jgi:acetylornithine deacetylase/succinyl-diaminopimelate desuccinylase-like protein
MRSVAFLFFLFTALLPHLATGASGAPRPAFEPLGAFTTYLTIDTHASTREAARFLGGLLTQAGVSHTIYEKSPGQVSLVAIVAGLDPSLPPLLLLHHMDSVYPPGRVREEGGLLYGASALDDKSLGIAHLAAFLGAAASHPRRGVVFAAVCGEETGGRDGMGYLLSKNALPDPWLALGEGGRNGIAVDEALFMSLATAEKGVLWAHLENPLPAGHGATPGADQAFMDLLGRLRGLPRFLFEPEILPPASAFFTWSARAIPQRPRNVPRTPSEVEGPFKYMTSTTLNVTFLRTDGENNVLPSFLRAGFDIRTLKPEHHAAALDLLRRAFPEGRVSVTFEDKPAAATPPDHPAFKRLMAVLEKTLPGLPKGLTPIPGFTDLRYLRARGVAAVGWDPFFTNYYHESTVHTPAEIIRKARFLEGVGRMKTVVNSLCAE